MNDATANMAFPAAPPDTVAIAGSNLLYPVYRIFCVGRNYEAHAKEMGVKPDREAPFYFTKSAHAIVASGSHIAYPPQTSNYHHEMEMVVALGGGGGNVAIDDALDLVFGYACGLDMTRRDLQLAARDKGRPWDLGKDFEQSAVISPIRPLSETGHPDNAAITLSVNGTMRQSGHISDLIWSVPELIANLSKFYTLRAGDLIYTGTPAGVGPVEPGDVIEGSIEGVGTIKLTIKTGG